MSPTSYQAAPPRIKIITAGWGPVKPRHHAVMSSSLCKKVEGAVFPFQVESLEDGVDDAVHALHVDEADHGPGSAAYFHETAFDDVGGAHLLPQVPGQGEERQQFRQIALQADDSTIGFCTQTQVWRFWKLIM